MKKKPKQNSKQVRFLNLVGHELRNPLNVIHGHAQLLSEDVNSKDAVHKLGSIAKAVEDMVNVIEKAVSALDEVNVVLKIENKSEQEVTADDCSEAIFVGELNEQT